MNLAAKIRLPGTGLPPSALEVGLLLEEKGPLTTKEISREAKKRGIEYRTVSFALRRLVSGNYAKRIPNLSDMRSPYYVVESEKWYNLRMQHEQAFSMFLK